MREFLNKNGKYVAVAALVLAGVVFFFSTRSGVKRPASTFFIDEDTGVESVRPVTDVPPFVGAKGNPSIVKVYKYTVGTDKTVKVGYYIKYTPEMKAKMEDAAKHPDQQNDLIPATGMLVRTPESATNAWVSATSSQGKKILEGDPNDGPRDTVYP